MGDNNVASIGKMLMQTQSGQSVTGVDGADIGTTFRKMVDQMTQIPGSSVSTGSQTAQNMQQLTPHSLEQNYDRYQYQKNKIPEQSTKDWAAGSQVSEKLESFEESVRDVIKDELQVTDEQITEAMETLGLTVADLMNPQQLAALAAELTGTEDMSALLCNEAFMNVMQSVGTLTEDLLQQLGVTAEELTQLLEDAGQTDMDADLMQTVQTADAGETDVKDAQKVYADTADGIRDTAEQPQMAAQAAETETRTEEAKDITPEETDAQAKTANAGAEEETAADAAAGSDKEQAQTGSNSNSGQQNFASQAHAGVDVHTFPHSLSYSILLPTIFSTSHLIPTLNNYLPHYPPHHLSIPTPLLHILPPPLILIPPTHPLPNFPSNNSLTTTPHSLSPPLTSPHSLPFHPY